MLAITPVLFSTYLVGVYVVRRRRLLGGADDVLLRNAVIASFIAFAVLTVTMARIGAYSLFWLEFHLVPGARAIRAGGRAQIVTNGIAAAVVAIVLARVLTAASSRWVRFGVYGLALIMVVEQVNAAQNHHISRSQELAFIASVPMAPAECRSFYISPVPGRNEYVQHINAMTIAQRVGIPTLNGYSGLSPPGWPLWEINKPGYRENALKWAKDHGVAQGLCEYAVAERLWRPIGDT